jgi:sugar (pentulose or hexulose) kinase
MVTAVGIGGCASFDEAVQRMVKIQRIFEPDPENVALYKDLFENVYQKIFPALKPLYDRIKQITGYPE